MERNLKSALKEVYGINANIKVQYNVDKKFDYFKEKKRKIWI